MAHEFIAVEENELEDELREREEQLRTVLEAKELGSWDRDFRTCHIAWNTRLFHILDRDREEPIAGDTFFDYIHRDDQAHVLRHVDELITSGSNDFKDEFRIVRQDGEVR